MNLHHGWDMLKTAGQEFLEDKAPRLGAALAYYSIFSLAPLLVIILGIVGFVYGQREAAEGYILAQFDTLVGKEGGDAIRAMLKSAGEGNAGIVGSALGILMLLVGATGLFGQLQDALNTIWEVQAKPGRGFWAILQDRFLSFSLILGIAFLLLMSLLISAALAALSTLFGEWQTGTIGQIINFFISFGVITVLFAMIFRYLPDAQVAWKDVWLGAIVTSLLFNVGKLALGIYLGSSGVASGYGAAGSLAVLLVWLYYSSQIFLFGAEITQVYSNKYGSEIRPKKNAMRVTEQQRGEEGIPHNIGEKTRAAATEPTK